MKKYWGLGQNQGGAVVGRRSEGLFYKKRNLPCSKLSQQTWTTFICQPFQCGWLPKIQLWSFAIDVGNLEARIASFSLPWPGDYGMADLQFGAHLTPDLHHNPGCQSAPPTTIDVGPKFVPYSWVQALFSTYRECGISLLGPLVQQREQFDGQRGDGVFSSHAHEEMLGAGTRCSPGASPG